MSKIDEMESQLKAILTQAKTLDKTIKTYKSDTQKKSASKRGRRSGLYGFTYGVHNAGTKSENYQVTTKIKWFGKMKYLGTVKDLKTAKDTVKMLDKFYNWYKNKQTHINIKTT